MTKPLVNILTALALVASACMIAAGTYAAHHSPFRQDRHMFEYMGQCIIAGRTLYVDCWDNKPPLVPWINAAVLAVTRDSTVGISVAAGLAAAVGVTCATAGVWICCGPLVAGATALLGAFLFSLRQNDGCTNGTELYATMFESIAALCLFLAWRSRAGRLVILSAAGGAAFGGALLAKQHALGGLIAVLFVAVAGSICRPALRRRLLGIAAAALLGFAGVIGAAVLVLRAQHILDDAVFAIFTSNLAFVRTGQAWFVPRPFQLHLLTAQTEAIRPVLWLAATALLATLLRWRYAEPSGSYPPLLLPNGLTFLMALWLVFGAWTVTWGPSHLPRYWHATYVPMIWLSAQALSLLPSLLRNGPAHLRAMTTVMTLTAISLIFGPAAQLYKFYQLQSIYHAYDDPERARIEEIAAEVQRRTAPADEIYVWGFEPGIYRFSHRFSPSRFFELGKLPFLGANAEFIAREVIETLRRRPPALILIGRGDYKDVKEGTYGRVGVREFADLLNTGYEEVTVLNDFCLFARRTAPTLQVPFTSGPATTTASAF